jgi:tetratricopeptide (TPR) repeat protein
MQQYRVNYPLLIGLAVGTFVSSGAVYALWRFQIERRSDTLIAEAEKAREEGNPKGIVNWYAQYVQINPEDVEQRLKLAEACADLAEQYDASMEDRGAAIRRLESILRDLPNEKGLRFRLAQVYAKFNMVQDALAHLDFILDNPEARVMRAALLFRAGNVDDAINYAFKVVGYDSVKNDFDPERLEAAPTDPSTYLSLATALRSKERNELADRVMEQAILANPKSAKAHLARAQYRTRIGEIEGGLGDFEEAFKLGPEDPDVLLTAAGQAANDKDYEKAQTYIKKGKELHPQNARFYQLGAAVASLQKDFKTALAELDEGLKTIPPPAGYELLLAKADLQLESQDYKGVRETIDELKGTSIRSEFSDWYQARLLLEEQKWFPANELLTRLRPVLGKDPRLATSLHYYLGLSYLRLGQNELAMRSFNDVLQLHPENEPARLGKQQAALALGRTGDIASDDPLDQAVQAEMGKPKAEQKWTQIEEKLKTVAEERGWDETQRKLVWGKILLARKEFAEARRLANEINQAAPDDQRVKDLALQAVRFDTAPEQGPAKALQMLERLNLPDQPYWRLYKADLLISINDERTRPQLASLLNIPEEWTLQQKVSLWNGMFERYMSLDMDEDARRCLMLIAENQPDDLQSHMRLFSLALEKNDDEAVKAAQDGILKVVGSTNDENWLYAEARRRLSLVRRGRAGKDALPEIRQLLARALEERPEWHELHALNAEVELLANNFALALKHLDRAESLGRLSGTGMTFHIRLLAADGQLERAAEMMMKLPENSRQSLLGDLYTELLFRTNKIEDAIKTARTQAAANPDNYLLQFRYGQLLARSIDRSDLKSEQKKAILAEAVKPIEQSVKLQPEFAEAWYNLIVFNAMAGEPEKAQQVLRDMQLSLSGDNLQFTLARSYEALGRWFDAEPLYRAHYEANPEDIERAQQLAAFYVGSGYRQRDMRDKAAPLINQILRAGADGKLPPGDRNLLWARRTGAKLLSATGDYQQLRKAERMLASNSQDGNLPLEDRLEMAQILAPRPEPESRIKAIGLLEEVDRAQQLGETAALVLGNLYFSTGDWNKCQSYMLSAVRRFPTPMFRARFVEMLLSRGTLDAYSLAEKQFSELMKVAPNAPKTFELGARLAIKQKKEANVRVILDRNVPRNLDPKAIKDEMVPMLDLYAALFIELKELDRAEQIHRTLEARDPKRVFVLALFLGTHRDAAQAFDLLDAQYNAGQVADSIRTGIQIIRSRRDEIGDSFDARVEGWLNRALETNIGSVPLTLAKAEFLEIQQKYPEAIAIYRRLLANPDIVGFGRAVMLNNLSYMTALTGADNASADIDPLALVQEAAQIIGPTAEILDTRAVVYISRKRYDEAIGDLDLGVTVEPTASKYFHKAIAHNGNKENRAMLDAWNKAVELGLSRKSLNQLEHKQYDELSAKIEQLQKSGTIP